ncbi:hypothetical protein AE07_00114 [Enterobacter cloacae BWH 43]|nr:hypothetical protein AE07_00114 [Enterobacter cloacae BWH 43]
MPTNNTCTDNPLSLEGEGWGEGEHTAEVVISFTLCSLLLCKDMAGLPAVNRRFLKSHASLQV